MTVVLPADNTVDNAQQPKGFLHDVWVIARRGLVHMRRQPEQLTDATIQPIMFVLLFAYVFGGAIDVPGGGNYREFLMGGIFAQTIVFTAFGVAMALANDRKNQAVDRFRSMPIANGAVLGGHALASLFKAFLPIALMSACGLIVGWRIRSGAVDAIGGYALLVGFAFAMVWVGVLLGSLVRTPEGVTGVAFIRSDHHHAGPAAHDRGVEPRNHTRERLTRAVRQSEFANRTRRPLVDPPSHRIHRYVDRGDHRCLRARRYPGLPAVHLLMTHRQSANTAQLCVKETNGRAFLEIHVQQVVPKIAIASGLRAYVFWVTPLPAAASENNTLPTGSCSLTHCTGHTSKRAWSFTSLHASVIIVRPATSTPFHCDPTQGDDAGFSPEGGVRAAGRHRR